MKDIIYSAIKENVGSILAVTTGLLTAVFGYFTVGKHKHKKERLKIEMETDNQFREQLLKVNSELSKVFDLHLEASKKHHAARLEIDNLKSAIKTKCTNSCTSPIAPESNKNN